MKVKVFICCDVCGKKIYHPDSKKSWEDRAAFSSKLLGTDDVLCWYCYVEWYDGGQTDRKIIKYQSKLARYKSGLSSSGVAR